MNAIVTKKDAPKLTKLAQFKLPDGRIFGTQKEANEALREYLVVEAVNTLAATFTGQVLVSEAGFDADGNDVDAVYAEQTLGEFIFANKAGFQAAFDAAKVERAPVSEETKAKMAAVRAMTPEQRKAHMEAKAEAEAAAKAARKAAKEAPQEVTAE